MNEDKKIKIKINVPDYISLINENYTQIKTLAKTN